MWFFIKRKRIITYEWIFWWKNRIQCYEKKYGNLSIFYENYEHFKNLIQDDEILNDIEETIKKYRSKDSLERLHIGKDIKEILDPFMIENDIEWLDDEILDEFLKIVMLNPFGDIYWGE